MPKSWKFIKDPVHHYIRISNEDLKIVDTPLFQRLRNIFHLGTGYLTYPGATHSRFEHSLGVADLGTSVLKHAICNSRDNGVTLWDVEKDELNTMERTLRCACLLHDIGHSPFSHTCEEFFDEERIKIVKDFVPKLKFATRYGEKTRNILADKPPHELVSCSIVLSEYSEILESIDVEPLDVCAIILGRVRKNVPSDLREHYEILAKIVSSPIDVDKFDYLLRDNYMTGASLAAIDKERLLSAYTVTNNNILLLSGKALSLVSNLMTARQQVFMWIYQHHKVVYTDALLKKIIKILIEDELINKSDFFSREAIISNLIDDYDIVNEIRENRTSNGLQELYESWRTRTFLKACWKHAFEFYHTIQSSDSREDLIFDTVKAIDDVERRLCDDLNIDANKLVIAHAKFVPFVAPGLDIQVEVSGVPRKAAADLGLFIQNIRNYCEVPYFYIENSNKDRVIAYLREYKSQFKFT